MAKKILVIDDEPDVLKVLLLRLGKMGYQVSGGVNGREAIDFSRRLSPDLIVLDFYLPDMNGDMVVRILKGDEKLRDIPVILISASTGSVAEKAASCGASICLEKPFEPQDLIGAVKKIIG